MLNVYINSVQLLSFNQKPSPSLAKFQTKKFPFILLRKLAFLRHHLCSFLDHFSSAQGYYHHLTAKELLFLQDTDIFLALDMMRVFRFWNLYSEAVNLDKTWSLELFVITLVVVDGSSSRLKVYMLPYYPSPVLGCFL